MITIILFVVNVLVGCAQLYTFTLFAEVFVPKRFFSAYWKLLILFVCSLSLVSINLSRIAWINTLALTVFSIAIVVTFCNTNLYKCIILGIVVSGLQVMCDFLTYTVLLHVYRDNTDDLIASAVPYFILSCIPLMIFFCFVWLFHTFFHRGRKKEFEIQLTSNIAVILIPLIGVFLGYFIIILTNEYGEVPSLNLVMALFAMLIITTVLILFGNEKTYRKYLSFTERNSMRYQEEFLYSLVNQQEKHIELMQIRAHDYEKHIRMIRGMVVDGINNDDNSLEGYIDETLRSVVSNKSYTGIENRVLRVILCKVEDECQQKNINWSARIEYSDFSFLSYSDICALIYNAIENSLYACQQIQEGTIRKYINLLITCQNEIICIIIKNSKSNMIIKTDDGSFFSTKDSPDQHGIGIKNMQRIVKKYSGELNFKFSEQEFVTYINFPLP